MSIKPVFNIEIDKITDERQEKIEKKIKENKNPNLTYEQKLIQVLDDEKTTTYENPLNQKYFIDTKEIQEEWENKIQQKIKEIKDTNLSYYEKRIMVLSELKTTEYIIERKNEEKEKEEKGKECSSSLSDSTNSFSSLSNEDNKKEILYDDGLSISKKQNQFDISYFTEEKDKIIQEKKNNFNTNLNELEKRIEVLKTDKTSSPTINKMEKKDPKLSDKKNGEEDIKEEKTKYINENNISTDETRDSTNISLSKSVLDNSISTSIKEIIIEEKKYNPIRNKYYIKNKLYDQLLNIDKNPHAKTAEKFNINKNYYSFTYNNDLTTYYITESYCILPQKKDYVNTDKKNYKSIMYESLGLYFCGNTIEYENNAGIREKKKCCPDEFICKDCMKLNKDQYYIEKDYLININGRVAKMNKGKYHCFGHFREGNQIEDCINKFTCKACEQLNSKSDYYIEEYNN